MDMDHMHDPGVGMDVDYAFARGYWYTIAGVVGALAAVHGINYLDAQQRLKACRDPSIDHPTRPRGTLSQAWATATAVVREMGHPQYYISTKGLRWATPLPLGRIIVLACYWVVIVYLMSWRVSKNDVYYWERIGYRNAWVTLTQFPLLYLLSTKVNVIGFLIGSSHERLNWLHRWVARTMFVTATVHGFHFWTMWVRAEFLDYALQIMPLVKYGLAAWAILLWNVVTGIVPIRRLAYELWVAQHVLTSIIMLWLLYKHIPANARWLLWMSISFLVFDRAMRWVLLLWQNVRLRPQSTECQGMKHLGHRVVARVVGPATTVITIKDVHFKWKAGQHIYLWVPRLGPFEAHPYTIACAHKLDGACCCNSIQLVVRAHNGFSKRLHEYATKNSGSELTGFVSGPYGVPPKWNIYETLVLIGASTGASFVVPILESIAAAQKSNCTRRVEVILVARTSQEIQYYVERAEEAGRMVRAKGVGVSIHIAITGSNQTGGPIFIRPGSEASNASDSDDIQPVKGTTTGCCCSANGPDEKSCPSDSPCRGKITASVPELIQEYTCRPDIETMIREPVEQAWGETGVVVCAAMPSRPRRRTRPERLSRPYALVHAGVRLIAWVTSLAAILMLAWVGKEWPSKSQVIIAGAVGCATAMLNDSWDILAVTDASFTVPRLAASRRVLHDLFSLALCVGGIIMMWVSNINVSSYKTSEQKRQEQWLMAALWALIAVV
ncbi:ferric reductase (metalloreductase) [Fusarium beomiforme]|uniref:ferric-chelate reductase (NADPH) n=1 Tax=Fusarium beomiforme TaxID=44412 RepID=A0A9P5DZY9_9HYPO|nr:ferric reductase (metalloreductase) [Fusarium beomiforme]